MVLSLKSTHMTLRRADVLLNHRKNADMMMMIYPHKTTTRMTDDKELRRSLKGWTEKNRNMMMIGHWRQLFYIEVNHTDVKS